MLCNPYYLVRVEIQACHRVVALGFRRFLFYAQAVALWVEFGHPVSLRIADPVPEYGSLSFFLGCTDGFNELFVETGALEYVVSEHEAGAVVPDEILADDKCLGKAVRRWLLGIFEVHSEVAPVAQEAPESRQVGRRRDDQDVPYAGVHQD